jgi:hypothetical protein
MILMKINVATKEVATRNIEQLNPMISPQTEKSGYI